MFVYKLLGGVGFEKIPESRRKILRFPKFPVDLGQLSKEYVKETYSAFFVPLLKEFNYRDVSGEIYFRKEFDVAENTKSVALRLKFFSDASCQVYCDISQKENMDVKVTIEWGFYCEQTTGGMKNGMSVYEPNQGRRFNLRFIYGVQVAVGKMLNKFQKDAHLPFAVLRHGTGAFLGKAEKQVQEMLGNRLTLEAKS